MSKIITKLNLNKTPQLVENNSLILAKNIRLLKDGTIGPDTSLKEIECRNYTTEEVNPISDGNDNQHIDRTNYIPLSYIAQIVGVNNKIYFFKENTYPNTNFISEEDLYEDMTESDGHGHVEPKEEYEEYFYEYNEIKHLRIDADGFIINEDNNKLEDINIILSHFPNRNDRIKIFEYDEESEDFKLILCSWSYSGGKINGCVTINNTDEPILTICEYSDDDSVKVPIKHINLKKCKTSDDETIYTQTPNIPITNLIFVDYYTQQIPAGVYQFYIRYRIDKDAYTHWMPCSKEVFAGTEKETVTVQGVLKYIDKHSDSDRSFMFSVEHLFEEYENIYKDYQLGFILSHDDGVVARSWKHFKFSQKDIFFDYNKDDVHDENIDDFLSVTYDIFNVNNVVAKRNKLYISNYEETDFNDNLQDYANTININILGKKIDLTSIRTINGLELIQNDGHYTHYINENHPIKELIYNTSYCFCTKPNIDKIKFDNGGGDIIVENKKHISSIATEIYLESGWQEPLWGAVHYDKSYPVCTVDKTYSFNTYNLQYLLVKYIDNGVANYAKISGISGLIDDNSDTDFDDNSVKTFNNVSSLLSYAEDIIKENIVYVDSDNNFYISINSTPYKFISYVAIYTSRTLVRKEETFENIEDVSEAIAIVADLATFAGTAPITAIVSLFAASQVASHRRFKYIKYTTNKNIHIVENTCILDPEKTRVNEEKGKELNTLMPFTNYDFYIHYLKQDGIITNGYKITSKQARAYIQGVIGHKFLSDITAACSETGFAGRGTESEPYLVPNGFCGNHDDVLSRDRFTLGNIDLSNIPDYMFARGGWWADYNNYVIQHDAIQIDTSEADVVLYPTFNGIRKPDDYVACFISIHKTNNIACRCFNHTQESIGTTLLRLYNHFVDCLELDSLLLNNINNICVYDRFGNQITNKAKYISSGYIGSDVSIEKFGNVGHIYWQDGTDRSHDNPTKYAKYYWIVINTTTENDDDIRLRKITPYIKLNTNNSVAYDEYVTLDTPGYVSYCKKIKDIEGNGNELYISGSDVYEKEAENGALKITAHDSKLPFDYTTSYSFIPSEYNLNYLSLNEDITQQIRSFADTNVDYSSAQTDDYYQQQLIRQFFIAINSLTASNIYNLQGMYKDYTRKLFSPYKEISKIKFLNTVRSSRVFGDEVYRRVYIFDASEYYNIPTNRGKITNLVNVANSLYVHCEHTLYKFTENKTINANDEEVTLQETDIFNTGITDVFDAEYGYGGLKQRSHSLVTYNAYIFYDAYSKVIYAFGGDTQITPISDPIQKILDYIKPDTIEFVGDEINNRFFVNLKKTITTNNTIANYNVTEENICLSFNFLSKSFVSIHDFNYRFGFHTRSNTYFIADNTTITNGTKHVCGWSMYKTVDKLTINNSDKYVAYKNCYKPSIITISDMTIPSGINCVDSCVDIIVNTEYEKIKTLDYINWICSRIRTYGETENFVAEEKLDRTYPGHKIRIYSDNTYTDLIDLLDSEGKTEIANSYDITDPNSYERIRFNCGIWSMNYFRNVSNKVGDNLSIDDSLIYGKYFVIRLIFNNRNFKLENITAKTSNYEKAQ